MPGSKPKIDDGEGGSARIISAVGLSGPLKQPLTAYHTALNLKFVPKTHGFLRGIPHTAENLKLVPGVHQIPMVLQHTAENWKLVPGVHSADVLAEIFNLDKSDIINVDYSGNRMTGKLNNSEAQGQHSKAFVGNLTDGVRDLVYYEYEVIRTIKVDQQGVKLAWGDDFYKGGYNGIVYYDADGNSQTQSGMTTISNGDIVRVAVALGDMGNAAGLDVLAWIAINGGAWQGAGSPDPVTLTDETIGPINVYWPMVPVIAFDAAFSGGLASDVRLLTEAGDLNYSPPTGYTAAGSSGRFAQILRDTDAKTIGYTHGSAFSQTIGTNFTYRIRLQASRLSNGPGTQVAVLPLPAATGNKIGEMWIGHPGAGTYDFDGSQVQVLWYNGRSDIYFNTNQWAEEWSDTLNFAYDDTKDLIVSVFIPSGFNGQYRRSPGGDSGGTARRSGNFAGTTSGAGFSPFGANYRYFLDRLAIIA